MRRRAVLAALLVPATAQAADPFDTLRAGGILLVRHASAPGFGDPPGFRLGDCATQRNLGPEGRRQAAALGARCRAERVTVGDVIGSEWCRTRETAEIAFDRFSPAPAFNSFFDDRGQQAPQTAAARALLTAWSGPGALVVVTHQVNVTALTGIVPADAEGVVLQPHTLETIGRIRF